MTLSELRSLAAHVGCADPVTAAAIAMAESSGVPHAQGDPRGPFLPTPNGVSTSFGLWQVHVHPGIHQEYDPLSLLEPNYNAMAMMAISKGGTDWSAWSTAWEDARHRIGYLGPKAPYRQFMLEGG